MSESFSAIINTPPFKCRADAPAEVHSLVSHKHLYMYLLSMKSFLRFYGNVSVVVHDDGTLKRADVKILRTHIEAIKIIENAEADKIVNDILKIYPSCRKLRNERISQRQVFDFAVFAKENKLITLDSDTLFFGPPEEIARWIESENHEILYTYEEDPWGPMIEGKCITDICNAEKTPFKFAKNLCGGFVCFYKDMINLELVEQYGVYVLKNCKQDASTFYAQPITALCIGNSGYTPSILPKSYQNPPYFIKDPVFRHYWASLAISADYLRDAHKVLTQLKP